MSIMEKDKAKKNKIDFSAKGKDLGSGFCDPFGVCVLPAAPLRAAVIDGHSHRCAIPASFQPCWGSEHCGAVCKGASF